MEEVLIMKKKLLLLTQWFDPEPTFKGLLFAKALNEANFDVEVVTGFPNYPGGQLYAGYKLKLKNREVIDQIPVNRVYLYPSHDKSALKRAVNYISFAFSALVYCLFFLKRKDVIYCYHPPLTIGIAAVLISKIRRIPLVYDIQDMWPDTLAVTGMINSQKLLSIIGKLSSWVYRSADHLVVLSPGFKTLLQERGIDEKKITVIPNWCDEFALQSTDNRDVDYPIGFNIAFAGNLGKAQSLSTIIDAAEILKDRDSSINFIIIGNGVELENIKRLAQNKNLDNICFIPQKPMKDVISYLKASDALLVHLKKDPLFKITIPSKTQAYMFVGKPILMGVEGDAADIITKANAGLVFEPESTDSLVEAVLALSKKSRDELDNYALNATEYYKNNLSLKNGIEKFSLVFNDLIK